MKKLLSVCLTLVLALSLCAGALAEDLHVVALKGPTAMGMVQLMDRVDNGDLKDSGISFNIVSDVSEVPAMVAKGEVDIAAVPANLASVLYNKTSGGVQVLAINTLGVLYIVENGETISSVEDLRGKTIYASGKGATPEYALNYILTANGIDPAKDVTIEWKSEHAECLAAVTTAENGIAMLPQPFVTTAMTKLDTLRVALDLTEEWDKVQEGAENPSGLITGVAIVRAAYAQEHPEEVAAFMENYKTSVEYVTANTEDAAKLIGAYDIVPEAVALKALPECNITFVEGDEMKTKLSGYLQVLFDQDATSVGGTLPADDFYYARPAAN